MVSTREALADTAHLLRGPMRVFYIGQLFSAVGGGLTLALFIVYLHQVRGVPVSWATAVLSWMAIVGLASSPVVGSMTDRWGPRRVLLVCTVIQGCAVLSYGQINGIAFAFAAGTASAIGQAGLWAPSSALIAHVVGEEKRSTAFGVNFALLNLGLGLGGLIGSAIVDVSRPATFVSLYTVDALSYGVFFVCILSMRSVGGVERHVEHHGEAGWAEVLKDRALRRYVSTSLLLLTFGYASIEAGFAIFVTETAGLDERWIGIAFAANTAMIVLGQLTVIGLLRGRSRTKTLSAIGLLWGLSWCVLPLAPGQKVGVAAALCIAFMAAFALGETLWSPTSPALLNALAPAHLRGRYNASAGLTWSIAAVIGPIFAGAMIGSGRGSLWALICAGGCICGGLTGLRLRQLLTPAQDGIEPANAAGT